MSITRRDFLQTTAAAGAAAGLTTAALASTRKTLRAISGSPKKILILGGTRFLGPALVHSCLEAGHEVTLFNRGRSNPHLFPELEKLKGDRDPDIDEGLSALEGRKWDAVIDTSAYFPRIAKASAELLADNVDQYVFISSVSVYGDPSKNGILETDAVGTIEDETIEQITGQTYGPLKALCEQAVEAALPNRTINIRPGLIVGPEDSSDRFTYWPVRVDQKSEVLSPGNPDDPVQIIDVRDLADFSVKTIDDNSKGIFNACGPEGTMTMAQMLHGCWAASGGNTTFTWVDAEFLEKMSISAWGNMPVWIPPGGEMSGICTTSNAKAVKAGLIFRPLAVTVRDTLDWFYGQEAPGPDRLKPETEFSGPDTPREERAGKRRSGISAKKEREVLDAWHSREAATSQGDD